VYSGEPRLYAESYFGSLFFVTVFDYLYGLSLPFILFIDNTELLFTFDNKFLELN